MPKPGQIIALSPNYNPPILKGLKVHPDNPFKFDFILDQGDRHPESSTEAFGGKLREGSQQEQLKEESIKLIKYFLASLTIPEKDLWVNLSPYEKNRIIPQSFGQTEMGRDLLAEDYILKQITASLMYPEGETGKKFWKRIYEEAAKEFGTTNIPVNTFNKVWIVPEKAVIYENVKSGAAYVVEAKLKVMLEEDYLALSKNGEMKNSVILSAANDLNKINSLRDFSTMPQNDINDLGSQVVRELIIPELDREINQGQNFFQLRQVYNSLILATWYKKKIRDSILGQVYENKNKIKGLAYTNKNAMSSPNVSIGDPEQIYQRYLRSFKQGAYNYIKDELDPITQQSIPRKYFSGGFVGSQTTEILTPVIDKAMINFDDEKRDIALSIDLVASAINQLNAKAADNAMTGDVVLQLYRAWDRKLEESRPYWKKDPRLQFPYNYRAPSIAFDPEKSPHRKIGIYLQMSASDLPERNDYDFVPEDVVSNEARGLARELRNELMTDPDNKELVLVPARWPIVKHHVLVISRTEYPQNETAKFLISAMHWAKRGQVVEFHRRGEGVNYYHLQLFDPMDAPIKDYVDTFATTFEFDNVKLGELSGYHVPHIALTSLDEVDLQSATMAMHHVLDSRNIPYTRDILLNKDGQLVVVFFIFSGKSVDFRFNTLGHIRSDNFNLTERDIEDGFSKMFVSKPEQDRLRTEFWNKWTEKTETEKVTGQNNRILTQEQRLNLRSYIEEWEEANGTQKDSMLNGLADHYRLDQDIVQEFFMYVLLDPNYAIRRRVAELNNGIYNWHGPVPMKMPVAFLLKHLSRPWLSIDLYDSMMGKELFRDKADEKRAIRNKRLALMVILLERLYRTVERPAEIDAYHNQVKAILIEDHDGVMAEAVRKIDVGSLVKAAKASPYLSMLGERREMSFWEVLLTESIRYRYFTKKFYETRHYKFVQDVYLPAILSPQAALYKFPLIQEIKALLDGSDEQIDKELNRIDAAMVINLLAVIVIIVTYFVLGHHAYAPKKVLIKEEKPIDQVVKEIQNSQNLKLTANIIAHFRDNGSYLRSIILFSQDRWAIFLAMDRLWDQPKKYKDILNELRNLPINGDENFFNQYQKLNEDLDKILVDLQYSVSDLKKRGLNRILEGSVDKRLDYLAEKFVILLNYSIYPKYRYLLPTLEKEILPQFQALKHPLTIALPDLDAWLAYSIGGYHKDYVERTKFLSQITDRPWASAIVFAGNGPHTRYLYTDTDIDDINAETYLINGFIGAFWEKMTELARLTVEGKLIEARKVEKEVKLFAGALLNGLLVQSDLPIEKYLQKLSKGIRDGNPSIEAVSKNALRMFPAKMPEFLHYADGFFGNEMVDDLAYWDSKNGKKVTIKDILTGSSSVDVNEYRENIENNNRKHPYRGQRLEPIEETQRMYAWLRTHFLDAAMINGGIDFTKSNLNLQSNGNQGIQFHIDQAMLRQLQNSTGFTPVIINMDQHVNLREFLGISN